MSDNKCFTCCTKVIPVPQRVLIAFWCFCVVAISFAIRLIISFVIVEMVELRNNFTQDPTFDYCWTTSCARDSEVEGHEYQFDWSEPSVGYLLAAYSTGYFIVQLPTGILVNLYSEKLFWGFGMILASILTWMVAFNLEQNLLILILTRAGTGFFVGPVLNSMNTMLIKWFPEDELWIASGVVYSGIPFGAMISALCGGLILHQKNKWTIVFKLFGIAGTGLSVTFFFLIYGTPEKHPCISQREREFLSTAIERPDIRFNEIPWKAILSNPAFISLVMVRAGQDFGFNVLMNYFPKYYSEVLCLGLVETAFYTAIPFFCAFVFTILSTLFADYLEKRNVSPTSVRKIFSGFSSVLPAVFLVGASFFECQHFGVLFSFCLTMCGMGFYLSGICTNELALNQTFCGVLSGISNTGSALTAIAGPIVVGYLVQWRSLTEWRVMIWTIFIIFNAGTIPFMVWGSGNNQQFEESVDILTTEEISRRTAAQQTRKSRCIFL